MNKVMNDMITVKLFSNFVSENGPFDVIHFHSFEGISPKVLELKKKWPQTKFIHSIHDYGIICPNVKLWTSEGCNCYRTHGVCSVCLFQQCRYTQQFHIEMRKTANEEQRETVYRQYKQHRIGVWRIESFLRNLGIKTCRDLPYRRYKNFCINLINKFSDAELCVSNRVKEIIADSEVDIRKIRVNYIGTKAAEHSLGRNRNNPHSEIFTLLYMGYMTEAKGGYMLLDCLEKMKEKGKNVLVRIASKIPDEITLQRIDQLRSHYIGVELYNGYSHDDFPMLMRNVNLGIVPPLWEDNLPQVAVEMIANGIPVLCSANGGAHELNRHPDFCFSDVHEMERKLISIIDNRQLLTDYWEYAVPLTTMRQHVDSLIKIYQTI